MSENAHAAALVTFRLPGVPVPQGRPRVVGGHAYTPTKSRAHRKALAQVMRYGWHRAPLDGPVSVEIEIAGARGNSDVDNHAKMVLDALQDAEVIVNDSIQVVKCLIVRVVDGAPSTRVTLSTLAGQKRSTKI